jgi:alkanesulfonate monooxygenase SsuD/methylene tetrahydromethanopterin reductase-like flavin-dependent oxidoreductase (luciferase family)/molybdopterin converting factor small subunit
VKVRLFAALREITGASTVDAEAATVEGLLAELGDRFGPEFGRIAAAGTVVVDGEPAKGPRQLRDDSEVAVLPPVSGGAGSTIEIGIGLPNSVANANGRDLLEFARRADGHGFSTLGTIGRVVFPSHDDLIAHAGAAGVTQRIRLMTDILLVPTHEPVMLAKQAATVDSLSGGRLTLGVAVGGRRDDYEAVGVPFSGRGKRMDQAVEIMQAVWRGGSPPGTELSHPLVPAPRPDGIPLLFGGTNDRAVERVVRYGAGWTAGGGQADQSAPFVRRVREAWTSAGRDGEPRFVGLAYFALGDGVEAGRGNLRNYYAFIGDYAEMVAGGMLADANAIHSAIESHRQAGFDELILFAAAADPGQADLLADVVFDPARS